MKKRIIELVANSLEYDSALKENKQLKQENQLLKSNQQVLNIQLQISNEILDMVRSRMPEDLRDGFDARSLAIMNHVLANTKLEAD